MSSTSRRATPCTTTSLPLTVSMRHRLLLLGLLTALNLSACIPAEQETPTRNRCTDDLAACGLVDGAVCNPIGEDSFSCDCPTGYTSPGEGKRCEDADSCAEGALAVCGVEQATCIDTLGSFRCMCPEGYTTDGDGTACKPGACFGCDAICRERGGETECVSTIADMSSQYWRYACPSADDRLINNKTTFELDCRCSHTQLNRPKDASHPDFAGMQRCNLVTDSGNYDIGQGPSVRMLRRGGGADSGQTRLNGGFLDHQERTAYIGMQWGSSQAQYMGAIMAINVDWGSPNAGDRRILSGLVDKEYGSGPLLRSVQDVKRGPDGNLYTLSWEAGVPAQIMRINPQSGDRELVWQEIEYVIGPDGPADGAPESQCTNGRNNTGSRLTLQMETPGLALTMAPNGDFFFGIKQSSRTVGNNTGPRGIIRISADGTKCSWVTRFAAEPDNPYGIKPADQQGADYGEPNGTGPRGTGPTNFDSNPVNVFYKEDNTGTPWLYALDGIGSGGTGTRYYRVNVQTGDRELLFSSIIGDSHSVWDPHREVLWTTGGYDTTRIVALDIMGHDGNPPAELGGLKCLSTTSDWYQCMRGPGDGDRQNRSGTLFDPYDNNLLIVHGIWGLVRVEVATGNTYVVSR